MEASNADGLERSSEGGVARLELAKPPRNLLDPDVMAALREAILEADADGDVQAIVLTGAGEMFCGGLDIERIQAGADPVAFASALVELLRVLPTLGKPVIAAVNGDALASGYALVCAADIAVTVDSARIGTFEASVGIWPMVAQVPAAAAPAPAPRPGEPAHRRALRRAARLRDRDRQRGRGHRRAVAGGRALGAAQRARRRGARRGPAQLLPLPRAVLRRRAVASLEEFRGMFTTTEHTIEAGERA